MSSDSSLLFVMTDEDDDDAYSSFNYSDMPITEPEDERPAATPSVRRRVLQQPAKLGDEDGADHGASGDDEEIDLLEREKLRMRGASEGPDGQAGRDSEEEAEEEARQPARTIMEQAQNDASEKSKHMVEGLGGETGGRRTMGKDRFLITEKRDYDEEGQEDDTSSKVGMLRGVLFPTVQNILGVILFLRLPFIVGQAGWVWTCFIILLSCLSTFVTTLSMNAIATNGVVCDGGSYYMISRNIGKAFGGSVGILFWLGTILSGSMYILGFAEVLVSMGISIHSAFDYQLFSLLLLVLMSLVCLCGVKYIGVAGPVFLALALLCILSYLIGISASPLNDQASKGITGLSGATFAANAQSRYEGESLVTLLALFYPSVTGFTAGSNMSGELRDPNNAIPKGTLIGVFVTSIIYLLTTLMVGASCEADALKTNKAIMQDLAFPLPIVIQLGILFASAGAGLQCVAGAPRLLGAIAKDDVIPSLSYFTNPYFALALSSFILGLAVLPGNLDAIAPLVSMLNIVCYCFINFACAVQDGLGNPNWRPDWKYHHWSVALFGLILCSAIMFIISWWWTLICAGLSLALYYRIQYKSSEADWGDGLTGMKFSMAQRTLVGLNNVPQHTKNWRPRLLLLLRMDDDATHVLSRGVMRFCSSLRKGTGLMVAASVLPMNVLDGQELVERAEKTMLRELREQRIGGFAAAICAERVEDGLSFMQQHVGLGKLQPNTVVLQWSDDWVDWDRSRGPEGAKGLSPEGVLRVINEANAMDQAAIIVKGNFPGADDMLAGYIDVWWMFHDSGILALLPVLLRRVPTWRRCKIRIYVVALPCDDVLNMEKELKESLDRLRVDYESLVIVPMEDHELASYANNRTIMASTQAAWLDQLGATGNLDGVMLKHLKRRAEGQSSPKKRETETTRLSNAFLLNGHFKRMSGDSQLVIANLPNPEKNLTGKKYMQFLDAMTADLERVVLIKGMKKSVVTMYA